ncbi:MAG TPA: hypothetical protein VMT29_20755 [Steroidobacteraceae bacterium]|nr:hypothetical protein [Steroidobacteraceae bacterium]
MSESLSRGTKRTIGRTNQPVVHSAAQRGLMRRATIFFALLLGSADTLAQNPLDTALRDAQQLAQCMMALDSPCVIALSDIPSYQRLSTPAVTAVEWAKKQTHYFDVLRDHGWRWTRFDVTAPGDVLRDGTRLYAFVPYIAASTFGGNPHTTQGLNIALSVDGGGTWKFVDIGKPTPERIRLIVPSYSNQPLPPTGEVSSTNRQ